MGPGPLKLTQDVSKGKMQTKPAAVTSHWGIWCRRVGRGKTVPERVWSLGVDNATSLSAGVPPLHLGWRLERKKTLCPI